MQKQLSVRVVELFECLQPTQSQQRERQAVFSHLEQIVLASELLLELCLFGSSQNGFALGDSDLDVALFLRSGGLQPLLLSHQDKIDLLQQMQQLLQPHHQHFQVQQLVSAARVPVLKILHLPSAIQVDLSFGSRKAVLNSWLLRNYAAFDLRVSPLVFVVKHWAKQRGINDAANGTLSSYGYAMMVIHFLQVRQGSFLPCLQAVFDNFVDQSNNHLLLNDKSTQERLLKQVCQQSSPIPLSIDASLGVLLIGFFHYYTYVFNYQESVISIRTGKVLTKQQKWRKSDSKKPFKWRLSIEDPLETTHDVGRVIFHDNGQQLIYQEFYRAYDLLMHKKITDLQVICGAIDPSDLNAALRHLCYICHQPYHSPRYCPCLRKRNSHKMFFSQRIRSCSTSSTSSTVSCSSHSSTDESDILTTNCWNCGENDHTVHSCSHANIGSATYFSNKNMIPQKIIKNVEMERNLKSKTDKPSSNNCLLRKEEIASTTKYSKRIKRWKKYRKDTPTKSKCNQQYMSCIHRKTIKQPIPKMLCQS